MPSTTHDFNHIAKRVPIGPKLARGPLDDACRCFTCTKDDRCNFPECRTTMSDMTRGDIVAIAFIAIAFMMVAFVTLFI